jgi:hypothetical protein
MECRKCVASPVSENSIGRARATPPEVAGWPSLWSTKDWYPPLVPELTDEELREILARLDEVRRQSQELQQQIRATMAERAGENRRVTDPQRDERMKPPSKWPRKAR